MNTFQNKALLINTINLPYHLNLGEPTDLLTANLRLLDSHLPLIWDETLKIDILYPNQSLNQLAARLSEINPCYYPAALLAMIYTNRLRRVLAAALMGMNNTTVHDGALNLGGGSVAVKTDGETVYFNDYNWQEGLDLVMENTLVINCI